MNTPTSTMQVDRSEADKGKITIKVEGALPPGMIDYLWQQTLKHMVEARSEARVLASLAQASGSTEITLEARGLSSMMFSLAGRLGQAEVNMFALWPLVASQAASTGEYKEVAAAPSDQIGRDQPAGQVLETAGGAL